MVEVKKNGMEKKYIDLSYKSGSIITIETHNIESHDIITGVLYALSMGDIPCLADVKLTVKPIFTSITPCKPSNGSECNCTCKKPDGDSAAVSKLSERVNELSERIFDNYVLFKSALKDKDNKLSDIDGGIFKVYEVIGRLNSRVEELEKTSATKTDFLNLHDKCAAIKCTVRNLAEEVVKIRDDKAKETATWMYQSIPDELGGIVVMSKCTKCGKMQNDMAKYCPECGAKMINYGKSD